MPRDAGEQRRGAAARSRLPDLASLRRPPDGAARAACCGAAEHASGAGPGGARTTPSGSPRRSPGCSAASRRSTTRSTAPTRRPAVTRSATSTGRSRARLPDGSPYSALNPDTYYWAHACFVEHLITATDTFIRRLSRQEKEQIFAESITWFERYGVSARGTPRTYAEFVDYFERTLEQRLVAHRTASYGVGYATKGWPRPERVPATAVVAGQATGQRDQLLDHDRRDAAAGPRDPRPAVGRRSRAALPAVRERLAAR